MTVINGSTPAHMDMVGSEVIQRLLADKWKAYGSVNLLVQPVIYRIVTNFWSFRERCTKG